MKNREGVENSKNATPNFFEIKNKLINLSCFPDESRIIGRDKYLNSAVLALLVNFNGTLHFLLQKRTANIRQGGEISFPGGKRDKNDSSFLETALRECYEEMGINRDKIEVFGHLGTLIIPTGILVESFIGYIHNFSLEDLKVNPDEVEKSLLVPLEFFLKNKPRIEMLSVETKPYYEIDGQLKKFPAEELGLPKIYHKPWAGTPRKVYLYIWKGEIIWGITADIIYEAIKMISSADIE